MTKKWSGGVGIVVLLIILVLRYAILENPLAERSLQSPFSYNATDYLHWQNDGVAPAVVNPQNASQVVSSDTLFSSNLTLHNFTAEELLSLQTWNLLGHLVSHSEGLPYAIEAIKEAEAAWQSLMGLVQEKKQLGYANESAHQKAKERQCPYSIKKMNISEFSDGGVKLKIPCGLNLGSSITIIGTPDGLLGDFRVDLTGSALPGEPDPPIILHYNVRLHGDKVTEDPVIVQNTWTTAHDWGAEERCPSPDHDVDKKVDELQKCSSSVDGKYSNGSRLPPIRKEDGKQRRYFPFKQGYLVIATLRVGVYGIHMTVDGKHITSFAYRERLEPWLVSEVRISGDINLISVLASGLPTSEDLEHIIDLEVLKSTPLPLHKHLDLFIGVFSTANNFKHRMAIRRTWMQYDAVHSGAAAVRFFVGLHKNQLVNEELWNEARTYGDIQLMPFVDYYSLITWKTIAICIYGTHVVSARYNMKTDDDAFVRIDELLLSLKNTNVTTGLLYGRINADARPHRNTNNKWYISPEEWPDETYPPWAHGPGYVVSQDIAMAVYKQHRKGLLRMFKLEDVAMGIWIAEMKKVGLDVKYVKEERVYTEGCENGYVVAHYQGPRDMLCLWQKLQETKQAICCRER